MGGLFSSFDTPEVRSNYYNTSPRQTDSSDIYTQPQTVTRNYNISGTQTESASLWSSSFTSPSNSHVTNRAEYLSDYYSSVSRNRLSTVTAEHVSLFSHKLPTPRLVKQNYGLIKSITRTEMYDLDWKQTDIDTITFVTLSPLSIEYKDIYEKFYMYMGKKLKRNIHVTNIKRIQNPYLLAAFLIKEQEIRRKFGCVTKMKLFHGTQKQNIFSIQQENFNWRLHGKSLGHRFGKGVSFSPKSSYSKHYCDKNNSVEKVMILAYVLVAASSCGNGNTLLPPPGCDTTQKPNGDVIVKYDDNEFYPAYEIYFIEKNIIAAYTDDFY